MRVTTLSSFNQVLLGLRMNQLRSLRAQEHLSSGRRLLRPSDDPAGAARALVLRRELAGVDRTRGSIAAGHTRRGDEESIAISFTAKWTQLLGKSASGADPLQLYELLMFASGAGPASTSRDGEQDTLRFEFTILDPAGVASEKVTFEKVYRETLTMSEGNEFNLISFSGRDFEVAPTVERI